MEKYKDVDLGQVRFSEGFWSDYRQLVRDTVIPYQHEILWDNIPGAEPSYAVNNFLVAGGAKEGKFGGMVFQDSDIAKWLEAVGYSLKTNPDPALEAQADRIIDLVAKAQLPDGYVNTYYILNGIEDRFTNLADCHELYCLGHMIEAAVAYYEGTGKRALLDVVCRFTDLIDSLFGPEEGKTKGYPGHEEIELALFKLYHATGEERYLRLGQFFLEERGRQPYFFDEEWEKRGKSRHWGGNARPDPPYTQAHLPVREQTEAVGHAVRAVYLYTGMADLAAETGDASLLAACRTLWDNIVKKQLYITGGIGQTSLGEAFTFDYDLPNDTVYAETCASIGLIFFAHSMLKSEMDSNYADIMENALYNTVIAGMARDGKHFFYVNPLEVWPEASEKAPIRHHVKPRRPGWYACACCPPNVARLLASLGKYIYTQDDDTVYTHLYVGGEADFQLKDGAVTVAAETNYPWDGKVTFTVKKADGKANLAFRMPGWCAAPSVSVNDTLVEAKAEKGYLYLQEQWKAGDVITLDFPMEVRVMAANPLVKADAGRVALMRGPLVYCLEETDNGGNLAALSLDTQAERELVWEESLPGGGYAIKTAGFRDEVADDSLYYEAKDLNWKPVPLTFVPYYLWGNRKEGEMQVWIRIGQ
ncbi:MAG: glycoside hydrolase family 127 protein [Oscillospiraceae bacterium]